MKRKVNSLTKTGFILYPFCMYVLLKNIILFFLLLLIRTMQEKELFFNSRGMLQNTSIWAAVANGTASLISVLFLYRLFLEETTFRGEYNPDVGIVKQTCMRMENSFRVHKKKGSLFFWIAVWAGVSAIAFNMLLYLLPIHSDKYGKVENIQYAVPIWMGVLLYGFISPVVEEIVFRGLVYNRMKRYFSNIISILVTSFMFGAFHGNLLQALYGMSMGIVITIAYQWTDSFWGAVLSHTAANITVYLGSYFLDSVLQTNWINCVIFYAISVLTGWMCYIKQKNTKKNQ